MAYSQEVLQRVELALAQAKRVEREGRILKQMLAGLRDHLQPQEAQGEENVTQHQDS